MTIHEAEVAVEMCSLKIYCIVYPELRKSLIGKRGLIKAGMPWVEISLDFYFK